MNFLQRRIHPTWLFTTICSGILVGVTLAQWWHGLGSVPWLIAGCGLCFIVIWRQRRYMLLVALFAGMVIGLWRGSIDQVQLVGYHTLLGKHVVLRGSITEDVETNPRGQKILRLSSIRSNNRPVIGSLWVTTSTAIELRRDDTVTIDGKLVDGFGSYAGAIHDAKTSDIYREHNWALDVRDQFAAAIRRVIAEPMGSLGVGFLVGQKSALPNDFSEALKIAGLTHIVVASGYNLTILVRLARKVFEKVSKFQAVFASVTLILTFMAITGWSASMTRAGLVAGLGLFAWYYGRKFHPVTLLAIAGAVTVLAYPAYAWGNIGWELSFAAFAGVLILAPLLHAYFYDNEQPRFVARTLLETLSAQILTFPIMLAVFGQASIVAIISNLLVLPLVPVAMLLTFVAGLGQLFVAPIAAVIAWPADLLLTYMVKVIDWTAGFRWAQFEWHMPWWGVVIAYLVIVAGCVYMQRKTRYDLRQVNPVE